MHRVIEEIVESNRWRDSEFAKLKINASQNHDLLWLRMCIPMIYAHWEGYVASSLKVLLHHLNGLHLRSDAITEKMIVIGLDNAYRSLSGKQTFDQKVIFTEKFKILVGNPLKFKTRVETKSNLRDSVLEDICKMFCFRFENFRDHTRDINQLVDIRNAIAHGENSIIPDSEMVEKYIVVVTGAMDIMLKEIEFFLKNKVYLK